MHSVVILDSGDSYYILHNGAGYADGKKLYGYLDIDLQEIPTDVTIPSASSLDFIHQVIGRVISYEQQEDVLDRIQLDLKTLQPLFDVKQYWDKQQDRCASPKVQGSFAHELLARVEQDFMPSSLTHTYILYNTMYNISLVVESSALSSALCDIQTLFPEFVTVIDSTKLHTIPGTTMQSLKTLFHQKSFESLDELKNKYDAFAKLYEVETAVNKADTNKNENSKVKRYLEWHYTISGDVNKRMKANELYAEILNHLCIPIKDQALAKKRIASHLFDLKLQKKRFSDGYYYYGIEKKGSVDVSVEDIVKLRTSDLKQWTNIGVTMSNTNVMEEFRKMQDAHKLPPA